MHGRPWWWHLWSYRLGRGNSEEKIDIFGDTFCAGLQNVEALTSVFVRGGSEIPPIGTMGGSGATVAGCFMHNNVGARGR